MAYDTRRNVRASAAVHHARDGVVEIAQAHGRRLAFDDAEKLRAPRRRIDEKIARVLTVARRRQQTLGRNHLERGADGDEQIVVVHRLLDAPQRFVLGRGFVEEHHAGLHAFDFAARRARRARVEARAARREAIVAVGAEQRDHVAVQMRDVACARLLEQPVDVLRDEMDALGAPRLLPLREQRVRLVGTRVRAFGDALVVEAEHRRAIAPPREVVADFVDAVARPDAVAGAEGGDAAFRRQSRAGKHEQARQG
ncbi:conserved hypothetical protein [Paraburkholderia tropica]